MILLLWPLVVFAFYKKKHGLKTLIFIVHIGFVIIGMLGAREYVLIVGLQQLIAVPTYWLSAWLIAWGIRRYIKKQKIGTE